MVSLSACHAVLSVLSVYFVTSSFVLARDLFGIAGKFQLAFHSGLAKPTFFRFLGVEHFLSSH